MDALPLGLKQSTPRDVELTAAGRAVFLTALGLVAAAAILTIVMSRVFSADAERRQRFFVESVPADAEVVRLWQTSDDSHRRMMDYTFTAPEGRARGRAPLSTAAWRALHVGDRVAIRYRASDPTESYPAGVGPEAPPVWLAPLIGAAMASGAVGLFTVVRRERRLLESGRVAQGVVLALHVHRTSHGSAHRSMKYEFPLQSGARVVGKSAAGRRPPGVGSALTVIYDPERPKFSRSYPLALVRPVRS